MYSAIIDSAASLQTLIDSGADLLLKDLEGNTVFHIAYMYRSVACLRLLRKISILDEEMLNISGKTGLEMAGKGGDWKKTIFHMDDFNE